VEQVRTKATELAVELLRGSVTEEVIVRALNAPRQQRRTGIRVESLDSYAEDVAERLGLVVKKLALEIERHIR
jgi:hypothetical protein